jgi:hypothetical protein
MGTRGIFGFKCGQEYKLKYNHFDSYPDWLGNEVVKFAKRINRVNGWDELRDKCENLEVVDGRIHPTKDQKKKYERYANLQVNKRSLDDWYALQRNLQGGNMLTEVYSGYVDEIFDERDFVKDSLFCEYGYIINLDDNTLEFYKGFATEAQPGNPFGENVTHVGYDGTEYYPIEKVGDAPLDDIPYDWEKQFYPQCKVDEDCDDGEECVDGKCVLVDA